jgi:hypothetical protein
VATLLLWLPVIPGKEEHFESLEDLWKAKMGEEPFPSKGDASSEAYNKLYDKLKNSHTKDWIGYLKTLVYRFNFKNVYEKEHGNFPKNVSGNDDFANAACSKFDPLICKGKKWVLPKPLKGNPSSVMDYLSTPFKNQSWFKHVNGNKYYYLASVIAMATAFTLHNINKHDTKKTEFRHREKNLFETISLSEVYARYPRLNRTEDLRDFLLTKEHGALPAIVLFDTNGNERDNEGIAKAFHVYHPHNYDMRTKTKSRSRSRLSKKKRK